jgi:hypothetical protein
MSPKIMGIFVELENMQNSLSYCLDDLVTFPEIHQTLYCCDVYEYIFSWHLLHSRIWSFLNLARFGYLGQILI